MWLVTIWEPLPKVDRDARLLRTGLLANRLASEGWNVIWWASTFDRARKIQRFDHDSTIEVSPRLILKLLHARGYKGNISLRRMVYHRALAEKFARTASTMPPPDLLLCSMPPPEMAAAAAKYASAYGVPLVVDVRDPWPDLIADLLPGPLRRAGKLLLQPMYRATREGLGGADAIFGVSPALLEYGLKHAGRARNDLDQFFPIGYDRSEPPPKEVDEATAFWRNKGLNPGPGDFVLCFFGMMGRHCDLETVISAAKRLEHTGRRFTFVLCGEGDRAAEYRRASERVGNIIFSGWINSAAIWVLMRMSTVGLAPYTSAGALEMCLPNKPFEYLSAGLPVVSSLQGQLAAILSESRSGVTYRSGDPVGFADLLTELHDDPVRLKSMGVNARTLYEREYVAGDIYRRMASHLRRVVAAPRPDSRS